MHASAPLVAVLAAGWLALTLAAPVWAQTQVWRCGNEFTNQPGPNPEARGCRVVAGGNLSIVEDTRRRDAAAPTSSPSSTAPPPRLADRGAASGSGTASARAPNERVAPSEQQARDRDARLILDAELKQAQQRVAELQAQHQRNQPARLPATPGKPERDGGGGELQRQLERALSDVAAIERELARLPAAR